MISITLLRRFKVVAYTALLQTACAKHLNRIAPPGSASILQARMCTEQCLTHLLQACACTHARRCAAQLSGVRKALSERAAHIAPICYLAREKLRDFACLQNQ